MKIKKENLIIIFYSLYFTWLLTVVFLTQDQRILDLFTITIAIFYFIFLREKGDLLWFWVAAFIPLIYALTPFSQGPLRFNIQNLYYFPAWLPIAWGTTSVALRKFFILIGYG